MPLSAPEPGRLVQSTRSGAWNSYVQSWFHLQKSPFKPCEPHTKYRNETAAHLKFEVVVLDGVLDPLVAGQLGVDVCPGDSFSPHVNCQGPGGVCCTMYLAFTAVLPSRKSDQEISKSDFYQTIFLPKIRPKADPNSLF